MKKILGIVVFLNLSYNVFAQETIGPDGDKLVWVFGVLLLLMAVLYFIAKPGSLNGIKQVLSFKKRIRINLVKDRKYYPDAIHMNLKNIGNGDVDIGQPVLVFDNFWFKRKFKLKGTNNYHFYPLILGKGESHALQIDLDRFYKHDYRLKKYPKVKLIIKEREGRKLGSQSVFLRKTLFKF